MVGVGRQEEGGMMLRWKNVFMDAEWMWTQVMEDDKGL